MLVAATSRASAVPPSALRGCDAVVNLVGIKREDGTQTFEAVHVEATRHLLEAAATPAIRRFVHVSVVCSRPDAASPYHDTKWRAEELVRASGLDVDDPASRRVIYGPGDDMVTHLVKMIRFAPVFPVVGRGRLAPAAGGRARRGGGGGGGARAAAVGRPHVRRRRAPSGRRSREVVRTVARARACACASCPRRSRSSAWPSALMDALTPRPLSTPRSCRC